MGGHGGLNILPQKRWNVYNFENREKVRKDEEAAAREEQLKREDARRREAEFRLERLRQARGNAAPATAAAGGGDPGNGPLPPDDSRHINLFEGLQDFSSLTGAGPFEVGRDEERRDGKGKRKKDEGSSRDPKRKKEERPAAIAPEDEKYRMGYGVAGKGVKAPWYLSRPALAEAAEKSNYGRESDSGGGRDARKKEAGGKKTIEELRAERLEREKREKERERALLKSTRRHR